MCVLVVVSDKMYLFLVIVVRFLYILRLLEFCEGE